MHEDDVIETNKDFLVTETTLRHDLSADALLRFCKMRKMTGSVVFTIRDGGVRGVSVHERTKPLTEPESEKVRKDLGMEDFT